MGGCSDSHDGTSTSPQTKTNPLDLTALSTLNVQIPGGVSVPLADFLQLGAVNEYSQSSDGAASRAATGAVSDSGAVDTSARDDYPSDASLHLSELLGWGATSTIANLDLEIGAVTAQAGVDGAGTVTRDYSAAGATLDLALPAIAGLEDVLTGTDGVADLVDDAVGSLVGPNGALAGAIATLTGVTGILGESGVDITLTTDVQSALNTILDTPLEDADGVLSVTLRGGIVHVDLDKLLQTTPGGPSLVSMRARCSVL
ncbi:choice-of-anchor G family protein [Microbacterium sp. ARD32]|uniref:choice-of-anchor G family protein n=1 Tax=Microbacterium sp. ARD32 TaxID=2962577 RepID=UPI0028825307|nr:choice-of-anchor G family protein [Microbacterium sp. ARD32]MDT0156111.1 choice-of-anchor G family protein [Microbacterium sp. ARD32]